MEVWIVVGGKYGIVSQFLLDLLLGMNFLARAPLVLDLKICLLLTRFPHPLLGALKTMPHPLFYEAVVNERWLETPGFLQVEEIEQEATAVKLLPSYELDNRKNSFDIGQKTPILRSKI